MVLYLLVKNNDQKQIRTLEKSYHIYVTGLTISLVTMIIIGIYQIVSNGQDIVNYKTLSAMIGIGHILLTIGMVWTFAKIFSLEKVEKL